MFTVLIAISVITKLIRIDKKQARIIRLRHKKFGNQYLIFGLNSSFKYGNAMDF
jgi:hypothetical protein